MEITERIANYHNNSICRVCMQGGSNLFPIFNEIFFGDDTITVADIITECTKYPVVQNDHLPDQICNSCMEAARNAHQFKRQTEEAYCHLKSLYDITWVPKEEKNISCRVRVGVITTDQYTQTDKSSVVLCESCPKKFFVEKELREHRATSHVNESKKCRVCGESFVHLGQLKVHLSTEHPSVGIRCEFKCCICSREFTRKDHLKRHLVQVHKLSERKIEVQKLLEHRNKNQKIIEPSKTSSFKIPLDEPEIENPATITANLNNYSSNWPDYLENGGNEPIAIEDQNNESVTATNPFSSEDEDHHSFNSMKNVDVKQFVETIAQPEISIKEEPNDITDAYSYDDMNEPFVQQEASFPRADYDEDEYMYNDNELQLNFKQNNDSKYSTDAFINQRNPVTNNFYCMECRLEFKLRRNLIRHMLTHTDERPFACHLCFKAFKRKDNLQKHLRDVHQKNFSCELCEKKFGSMQQLMRHKKTSRHIKVK